MLSDNMEIKDILIFVVVVIAAAFVASFIFGPTSEAHDTNIQVLNKGDLGSNSTIYVKLTDNQKTSLGNETVHVKLLDNKGKAVYDKTINTRATGVGMAKLSNVSAGEYTLNVTYDGNKNFTSCSLSKKVKVDDGVVKDVIDNSTLDNATMQDILDAQQEDDQQSDQSQSSDSQQYDTQSTPSSDSGSDSRSDSGSDSSSSNDGYDVYYDADGNEMDPVIDIDGNQIDPTND